MSLSLSHCVFLVHVQGYSRYSCALRALGEEVKAECIHREAQTCFPKDKGALTQEWNKFAGTWGGGGGTML